jgi:hypothetical protein
MVIITVSDVTAQIAKPVVHLAHAARATVLCAVAIVKVARLDVAFGVSGVVAELWEAGGGAVLTVNILAMAFNVLRLVAAWLTYAVTGQV